MAEEEGNTEQEGNTELPSHPLHGDGALRMRALDRLDPLQRRSYIGLQAHFAPHHGAPDDLPTPDRAPRVEFTRPTEFPFEMLSEIAAPL